jgi:hypothetical protein
MELVASAINTLRLLEPRGAAAKRRAIFRLSFAACPHHVADMKWFAFFTALVTPLLAADDYELRMTRPAKVGERELKTGKYSEESSMVLKVDRKPVKADELKIQMEYEAESEILAVGANGKPTSRRVKLVKISGEMNGKPLNQLAAGDEIVVTRKAPGLAGRETIVNKQPATKEQVKIISGFVSVASGADISDDEVFGTQKRIKPGDEWNVNAEKAAKQMAESGVAGLEASGVTGSAKLLDVVPLEGVPCLRVRGNFELKGSGMPLPNVPPGVTVSKMAAKVMIEGNFPVDLTETIFPSGTVMMDMEMTAGGLIENNGKKAEVDVITTGKKAKTETSKRLK